MASSVYFKFKSQKEPTRVEFDGTGISVFELKRDIILKSGLGDGTDFDLAIYAEDGKEEYDDDTTIIPRSTTVIARRLPPMKPGAGRAARYVSGKMPVNAKNASRREQTAKATAKATSNAIEQMNNAMTEEDKLAAMFAAQSEQWNAQQEEMSHQTPIFKPGSRRPANVPDHDPPNGYICYRCGEKGHWIQLCPTNDNPEFDNRPRVKRTTGIPRSFLKTVDKAAVLAQAADEDAKAPSGIMVNAEGEFVIAEPDKASWEKFQAKTKVGAAAQEEAALADKELQERGLECPIDKKLFIDPMKTPCCGKTYCNDCITNALIESDFVCPGCQSEGVLIDDLKADEEAEHKIEAYQKDKEASQKKAQEEAAEAAAAATATAANVGSPGAASATSDAKKTEGAEVKKSPAGEVASAPSPSTAKSPAGSSQNGGNDSVSGDQTTTNGKKRPAETEGDNPKIPKAPKAMQQQTPTQNTNSAAAGGMAGMPSMDGMGDMNAAFNMGNMGGMSGMGMGGMNGMNGMNGMGGMNGMSMGNMGNMGNMGMGMMPFGGMPMMNYGMGNMGGMGGMGMPNMPNMPNMGNMGSMGMGNMGMGNMGNMNMMNPMMGMNGGNGNGGYGGNNFQQGWNGNSNGNHMNMNGNGGGYGGNGAYANRSHNFNNNNQFNNFQGNNGNNGDNNGQEDDAYFRKPVNPHRHFNKPKRVRPSDYREL